MRALLVAVPSLVALLLADRPAHACGALPEPINYFTFGTPTPTPGATATVVNPTIILRGQAFSVGGSPIVFSWFQVGAITMTDQDGAEVPLRSTATEFGDDYPLGAWVPVNGLRAETEYHVTATLAEQSWPRPAEATGSETIDFRFTTGIVEAPPLALDGDLAVELHSVDEPVMQCETNDCGGESNCVQTGTRSALMASVSLPAAYGGTDVEGYLGYLVLAHGVPATFAGPGPTISNGMPK